jgi:hypothetical protein
VKIPAAYRPGDHRERPGHGTDEIRPARRLTRTFTCVIF